MDNRPTMVKSIEDNTVEIQSDILDKMHMRQEWQRENSTLEGIMRYMRKYGTPEQKASLTA
nr:MAG TPA: hypothetical protein [Caudoviricetes sp.]